MNCFHLRSVWDYGTTQTANIRFYTKGREVAASVIYVSKKISHNSISMYVVMAIHCKWTLCSIFLNFPSSLIIILREIFCPPLCICSAASISFSNKSARLALRSRGNLAFQSRIDFNCDSNPLLFRLNF